MHFWNSPSIPILHIRTPFAGMQRRVEREEKMNHKTYIPFEGCMYTHLDLWPSLHAEQGVLRL